MSKVEDCQLALAHLLERLVEEDASLEVLACQIAPEYDVATDALVSWALRSFASEAELADWRNQKRTAKRTREARNAASIALREAAEDWAAHVWKACEPDGEPDWYYCYQRFLRASDRNDPQGIAYGVFMNTKSRFDEAHSRYLMEHGEN